ncbi:MAG: lipoyl(octanoyl) transferase LipB [Candidatus Latescibacteria bacterium]|nr:lipoyl(octanoyl) transferase LipB [Candidatus Latescibacterota bacterium]
MPAPIAAFDLGRVPYREALELQQRAVLARASGERGDSIYFVEHEPVLTVGRSGRAGSLIASLPELRARGVEVVPVERGGDVTYHGPGQVVAYPIVALEGLPSGRDLHRYLRDLEEVIIRALATYGIRAARRPPYTGVWVGERKVAAIGVAVRRWIAFHGFALNVDPDLSHFDWIHPCGIRHLGVTSLRSLLGASPGREDVLARLRAAFAEVWARPVVETLSPETLHA